MNDRKPSFTIEPSKAGPPTLAVDVGGKMLYVHSRVDPSREGEAFRKMFTPDKYDLLVVLGLGLGYHLKALVNQVHRYRRIVLVDVLGGIEKHWDGPVRSLRRYTDRVSILSGNAPERIEGALEPLLDLEGATGVQVLEHPASLRAFPAYYSGVKSVIETLINRAAGNRATVGAFGYRYLMNVFNNIPILPAMRPLAPLYGRFARYPALVVTPGPSLDDILHELREFQHRIFIVAADSALPVLSRSGITADFLLSIDPQVHLHEHFAHGRLGRTVPVYALPVHPLPFRRFPGLVYLNSHPLCQLLEKCNPDIFGSADSATGTVAGDAVALALRLGFSTLGLAGFDFSFPRFSIYARGSAYQERFSRYFQARTTPVETNNFSYIMGSSKGQRQGGLFTRKSFMRYREGIGRLIAGGGSVAVSLTAGGVPLESVARIEPEIFFQPYREIIPKEQIIDEYMKSIPFLSDLLDIQKFYSLLAQENILVPLLQSSLHKGAGTALYDRAEGRIRDFLDNGIVKK